MDMLSAATATALSLLSVLFIVSAASDADSLSYRRPLRNGSLCAELVTPSGYLCSEYTVQTKDGYLLALQRVSSSSVKLGLQHRSPVLLQHGLFMGGDAWFLNGKDQSLGFILADQDFDVWVGNVRGTRWSHGHISLSEKDKEYWDWSWEELALYDLAEMINYIYSTTSTKIYLVGHSQGTIMSLAALTQPNTVMMVEAAALLSPISYLEHVNAQLVRRMVSMHLDKMILAMGIHELNFRSDLGVHIIDSVCDGHVNCSDLLSSITGKNCCFNNSRIDLYFEYEPHPSSSKNLNHLFQRSTVLEKPNRLTFAFQLGLAAAIYDISDSLVNMLNKAGIFTVVSCMIRKGTFARYDYGLWKNLVLYGSTKPPAFDLSFVSESLPIWMAYGGNDALADVKDVEHTLKELQGKPELVYLENYGHVDFLLSVNGKEDLYDHMIKFFRSFGRSSSY